MKMYHLCKASLDKMIEAAKSHSEIEWKLKSKPTIKFYQDLHTYVQHKSLQLSSVAAGFLYRSIDPWLHESVKIDKNAYRKIANLMSMQNTKEKLTYTRVKAVKPVTQSECEPTSGHYSKFNVDRREKRAKQKFEWLHKEKAESKKCAQKSEKSLQKARSALDDITNQLHETRAVAREAKAANKMLVQQYEEKLCDINDLLELKELDTEELTEQLHALEETVAELQEQCEAHVEEIEESKAQSVENTSTPQNPIIKTKQGKTYHPAVRKLYYDLLSQRVPPGKIASIIRSAVTNLVPSIEPTDLKLPGKSCANYMRSQEMPTVSRAHKAAMIAAVSDLHLNTDGTTLQQQKKVSAVASGIVLGVQNVADGTAKTALTSVEEELQKVATIAADIGISPEEISLSKVVSSTSDGAATQTKFNKLLQEKMKENGKSGKLISNKCSMHLGVNLRVAQNAGIKEPGLPDIDTVVHQTAKLIGHLSPYELGHGHHTFPEFLGLQQESPSPNNYYTTCSQVKLDRQVGSRYHVTAKNAGKILFLTPAIIAFLSELKCTKQLNQLEASVLEALQRKETITLLRIEGLMFDRIYADLTMLAKSRKLNKSVFDMNTHFLELKLYLEKLVKEPTLLLDDETYVFESEPRLYGSSHQTNHRLHHQNQEVRKCFLQPDQRSDELINEAIQKAAQSMHTKLVDYKKDQLPGGKYWNPDSSTKAILITLKPNNNICESTFGLNDWLTSSIPNMSQQARSTLIEFSYNRTAKWLQENEVQDQARIIKLAVSKRKEVAIEEKERESQQKSARQEQRKRAQAQAEKRAERMRVLKAKLQDEHLIATEEELEQEVLKIKEMPIQERSKKAKLFEMIKTQIHIRTKLLGEKSKIQFTVGGKRRPISQLISELSTIIRDSSVELNCPTFASNPEVLVGHKIKHNFSDAATGKETFWDGDVTDFNSTLQEYKIQYVGEIDCCYFTLDEIVSDYNVGDLIIL